MKSLIVLLIILSSCSEFDHGPDRQIPVQEYKKILEIPPDTVLLRSVEKEMYITTTEDGFISKYALGEGVDVLLSVILLCGLAMIFGGFAAFLALYD